MNLRQLSNFFTTIGLTHLVQPCELIVDKYLADGLWLDHGLDSPFAGHCITNQHKIGTLDFLKSFDDNAFDGVLFDIPYTNKQITEWYRVNDTNIKFGRSLTKFARSLEHVDIKNEIKRIVKVGGKVISFGWDANTMSNSLGFQLKEFAVPFTCKEHRDSVYTVEVRYD